MTKVIYAFLQKISELVAKKLTYRQPGDGSDGTCDCIGLIIGAIRRMGLNWPGIHGSNYAARQQTIGLQKITSLGQLEPGDIVYKAYEPGHAKYNLPGRYKKGGAYYNGDLKDYYHVGVVTETNPVVITHMTSPTTKKFTVKSMGDLSKANWGYFGTCRVLVIAAGTNINVPVTQPEPVKEPLATEGAKAVVTAPSGKYVKMRQKPSTNCGVYDEVPIGATVTLLEPGEEWAKICYGRRSGWYMMAKFLEVKGEKKVG